MDWHITKDRYFDEWIWYGNNEAVNRKASFPPPSPYLHGVSKGVLYKLIPNFSTPVLDLTKIKAWEKKEADKEKAREERPKSPPDVKVLTAQEDVKGLIDALREDHFSKTHKAAVEALAGIGAPAVESLIAAFKSAERTDNAFADKDKHLREGIVNALCNIGDSRALESLCIALDDNIPFVRIDDSRALEKIGEVAIEIESRNLRNSEIIQALQSAAEYDRNPEIYKKAKNILKVIKSRGS